MRLRGNMDIFVDPHKKESVKIPLGYRIDLVLWMIKHEMWEETEMKLLD